MYIQEHPLTLKLEAFLYMIAQHLHYFQQKVHHCKKVCHFAKKSKQKAISLNTLTLNLEAYLTMLTKYLLLKGTSIFS